MVTWPSTSPLLWDIAVLTSWPWPSQVRAAKAALEVPARQDDVRTAGAEGCDDGSSHAMTRRTRCTTYRNDICGALANKKYVKKYCNMLYVYIHIYIYMDMCTCVLLSSLKMWYNIMWKQILAVLFQYVCHTYIYIYVYAVIICIMQCVNVDVKLRSLKSLSGLDGLVLRLLHLPFVGISF